ncbi:peptide ABC transporter substrate-binding protein [Clostridia bacterium]|nr:peptide ABC transporter substrate-binding protein [Clostridia bacterium]
MKKMKRILALAVSSVLALGTMSACTGTGTTGNETGGGSSDAPKVLNWFAAGEVTTMDSGKTYDVISQEQVTYQNDTLYLIDSSNKAVPSLARELPKISDDGLTATLTIRDDAKYSNGDPITAADIVYAARRVVDPATGSQSAENLNFIKNAQDIVDGKLAPEELGIKATSDYDLEITLSAPSAFLNTSLSTTLLSPVNQKFVEEKGDQYALTADNLLSSGPYILKGWNGTDISWKYEKNPNFWDAKDIYFDTINIQVIKEVATGVNLYEAGTLDGVAVTGDYVSLYRDKPDLVTVQTLRMTNLEMGISSNPLLQNLNLRKALLFAVDRDELAKSILNGDGSPAYGVVPNGIATNPDNNKSINDDFGKLVYTDIPEAQRLFAEALKELGKDSITLRLVTSDSDESIKVGQYLQSAYETNLPGLKIDLANVPASVRFDEMMSFQFDLALGGWTGEYDPASYVKQFEASFPHNHAQWKSQEITDLIHSLENTDGVDYPLRWKHVKEGNQYLIDNAVVVPLVQAASSALVNPKLKGYVTHVLNTPIDVTRAHFE